MANEARDWIRVYKLVSFNQKSDVDFGCMGGKPEVRRGRLSKWKFTTSCASVSYNLVFAWTQTLHWNPAHLCLLAIL